MLQFNSILLFSENPTALKAFYTKVFQKDPEMNEGEYSGWNVGSYFMIGPHDKVKGRNEHPERILLNFETTDVAGEFDRIKQLGATVVAEPYHPGEEKNMTLATFSDPDGNFFQLNSPMPK